MENNENSTGEYQNLQVSEPTVVASNVPQPEEGVGEGNAPTDPSIPNDHQLPDTTTLLKRSPKPEEIVTPVMTQHHRDDPNPTELTERLIQPKINVPKDQYNQSPTLPLHPRLAILSITTIGLIVLISLSFVSSTQTDYVSCCGPSTCEWSTQSPNTIDRNDWRCTLSTDPPSEDCKQDLAEAASATLRTVCVVPKGEICQLSKSPERFCSTNDVGAKSTADIVPAGIVAVFVLVLAWVAIFAIWYDPGYTAHAAAMGILVVLTIVEVILALVFTVGAKDDKVASANADMDVSIIYSDGESFPDQKPVTYVSGGNLNLVQPSIVSYTNVDVITTRIVYVWTMTAFAILQCAVCCEGLR
eukprot:PhF_6_TR25344/c1_g1_i1/m.35059